MKWKLVPLLALLASPAVADEQVGPFILPAYYPDAIVLNGDITPQMPAEFAAARAARPDATTLILASPGGDINTAIRLGFEVKKLGMATWVMQGSRCASACAVLFFAGSPRVVDGELALHQPEYASQDIKHATFRSLMALGMPAAVFDVMWSTPYTDMHVLSDQELKAFGLR